MIQPQIPTIEIICQNYGGQRKYYPLGVSLKEIADDQGITLKYPVLGALVNNKLRELNYRIFKPKTIQFIDYTHPSGSRMYHRSLAFILYKTIKDLYPQAKLRIEHSVSKGWYAEIDNLDDELSEELIAGIKARMKEIIQMDLPFEREEMPTEEAVELYGQHGHEEKQLLFKTRSKVYTSIYRMDGNVNYFYGYLVPSTAYINLFNVVKYYNGLLIQVPKRSNPEELEDLIIQHKLFKIFREHKNWINILEVPYVGYLNMSINQKKTTELIKISEALHEKKIAHIADKITKQEHNVKLVLISGPSSSGKTTFSKRLSVQLQVLGLKPMQISLDNYFVDRQLTPRDENGDYDFECIEAIDVELFNEHLLQLLNGKEVEVPVFDFVEGKKTYNGTKLQMHKNTILVIEGIHGLNPKLTPIIPDELKFKIFVSALTQISIDAHNPIPSTDNRLIRRIVRDYRYRGYSALDTLRRWDSVRRGEEKNIFPYQENADVMFNSALLYELGVLKTTADPIIKAVTENQPEFAESVRLLKFLSFFQPISDREIPPTSILREFLGGSSFIY